MRRQTAQRDLAVIPTAEDGEKLMLACMEDVVSKRKNAPYASDSRPELVKAP